MRKTLLILRHEMYRIFRQPVFWLFTVVFPGIVLLADPIQDLRDRMLIAAVPSPALDVEEIEGLFMPEEDTRPQGYVDLSGLLGGGSSDWGEDQLIGYTNEHEARAALEAETISAYYLIPADYTQSMQVIEYTLEYNALADHREYSQIRTRLADRLLQGKVEHKEVIFAPLNGLQEKNLTPADETVRDPDNFMTMLLPYMVMSFFALSVLGTASMLLSSMNKERENFVLEVLLNSASPNQILTGKIIGLGLIGLAQVSIYGAVTLHRMQLSGEQALLAEEYLLKPEILAWGLVFFVFGYLLYAAIIAAVGALVPNLRETSQITTLLTLPAMAPYFFISLLINDPSGTVAVAFSLFPLTSSSVMLLRLASAKAVPLWQILLALGLLIGASLLVMRLAANLFRAQNLLSGQDFHLKRFLGAIFKQK